MKALLLQNRHLTRSDGFLDLFLHVIELDRHNRRLDPEGKSDSSFSGFSLNGYPVRSGAAGAQNLRLAADSRPGSYEPIPEGRYLLGDSDSIDGVNWASGRVDNYSGSWGEGLGPVWIGIHPVKGLRFSRVVLGIHQDTGHPGTAGCIGFPLLDHLKDMISRHFRSEDYPRLLVVDWGLGSVDVHFPNWIEKFYT